jgi:hypothetical protein
MSISSFFESSLYLFLMVTSVTPAISATSRCVLRSPQRIVAIYMAAAVKPIGLRPPVNSFLIAWDDEVIVDFNHPLADKKIIFTATVKAIEKN